MDLNNNIDFNKYKVFLAVADFKSFSKAAEYLYISQPAISHAIKELEDSLNTKLFIRNKKTVSLTEEGAKLKKYIRQAFNNISLGEKLLKEKNNDLNGVIRIGIYSHISLFMLPKTINEFTRKYPKAKFSIYATSNTEMLEKLNNNELDLLIMQYPIFINEKNIKEEIICQLETCFYTNKKYYDIYSQNNNSIAEIPIILPVRGYPDITKLEETLKTNNIILKHSITSYTTELAIELAKNNLGVAWGIKKCVEKELNNQTLYELKTNFELPLSTFSIAYNEELLNQTTKEFIKLFKENMKKISYEKKKNNK